MVYRNSELRADSRGPSSCDDQMVGASLRSGGVIALLAVVVWSTSCSNLTPASREPATPVGPSRTAPSTIDTAGATMTGTISGADVAGDDKLFGGLCAQTPCKVFEFTEFIGAPHPTQLQLRWSDATRQLALYKYHGDPDVIPANRPALRYTGASQILATVDVSGYFDAIAVAFEQADGRPPGPTDSEAFELTVRPAQ